MKLIETINQNHQQWVNRIKEIINTTISTTEEIVNSIGAFIDLGIFAVIKKYTGWDTIFYIDDNADMIFANFFNFFNSELIDIIHKAYLLKDLFGKNFTVVEQGSNNFETGYSGFQYDNVELGTYNKNKSNSTVSKNSIHYMYQMFRTNSDIFRKFEKELINNYLRVIYG